MIQRRGFLQGLLGLFAASVGLQATAATRRDREFDVSYTIVTDTVMTNAATLYASGVLPAKYAKHATNVFATVRCIAASRDPHDESKWRINVQYSEKSLTPNA